MTDVEPFADLAARAPKHDAACSRAACRRCAGPHEATPPKVKRNPHDAAKQQHREPSPFDPLVKPLRTVVGSMPDALAKSMLTLAEAITMHGDERWQRLLAWEKHQLSVSLVREEPGEEDDEDGRPIQRQVSSQTEEERNEDRRTGRYAEDARQATTALLAALASSPIEYILHPRVQSVRYLIAVAELHKPRTLKSREVLASQAAADGWCRSCFRVGVFEPIGLRPTGEPWYRDLCRWCGQAKGDDPQPSTEMVRVHHRLPETRKAS